MCYKPELFKSISSHPTIPIVNGNPNLITPMPLLLPCLIFWNKYLKQGIEKWTFKAKATIKPSQLYNLKYAQVLLQIEIYLMKMEIPIGIFHCDCVCDLCFLGINIVNGVVRKSLFNRGHPQNHHNCLTLNPCNVLLQIHIHSL